MTILKQFFKSVLPGQSATTLPPLARKIRNMRVKGIAYDDDVGSYYMTPTDKQAANNNIPATRLGAAISIMMIPEAWRCYQIRTQRIGAMKWQIKRYSDDSVYEDFETPSPLHPLARAIYRSERHFKQDIFAEWQASLVTTGEAFVEYVPDTFGKIAGLRVLPPLNVNIIAPQGEIEAFEFIGAKETIEFSPERIVFDRYRHTTSEIVGRSPMEVAIGTANVLYNLERFVIATYSNNGAMGVTLAPKMSEDELSDDEVKALAKLIREQYEGVDNASRTLVAPIPMDITTNDPIDMSKNVPLGTYSQDRLFMVFGTPRSMAGDWDSTRYKSGEETEDVFNRNTVIPEFDALTKRFNREIMPRFDSSGDYYFDVDTTELLRLSEDDLRRADRGVKLWQGGLATLNESRAEAKLPALDIPQGDEFYKPPTTGMTGEQLGAAAMLSGGARDTDMISQIQRIETMLTNMSARAYSPTKSTVQAYKAHDGIMIAFYLGSGIAQEYFALAQAAGLRDIVEPQEMHITLGYIGTLSDNVDLKALYQAIKEIAPTIEQVKVTIGDRLGRFINADKGDCIYISVDDWQIHDAHRAVAEHLLSYGIILSRRQEYVPHITLGYVGETEATPLIEPRTLDISFDKISLSIGDARYDFSLGATPPPSDEPEDDEPPPSDESDDDEPPPADEPPERSYHDDESDDDEPDSERASDEPEPDDVDTDDDEPEPERASPEPDSADDDTEDDDEPPPISNKDAETDVIACHTHEAIELPEDVKAALKELDAWRRKIRKAGVKAHSISFENRLVDDFVAKHIRAELVGMSERQEIDALFFAAEHEVRILKAYTYSGGDDRQAKSVINFRRRVNATIRGFWNGIFNISETGIQLENIISRAFDDAFKAGVESTGFVYSELTSDQLDYLTKRKIRELSYLPGLLDSLSGMTKADGAKLGDVNKKLDGWIARYDNVYELGVLVASGTKRLKWVYNPLKEHCPDCARLNGLVYTAQTWLKYDIMPKSFRLKCFGIYCGCEFVETDEPVRRGRPPKLLGSPLKGYEPAAA